MANEKPVDQPTFDSGCGTSYDLYGESGTITSMGYDGTTLYENNAECEFRITASEGKKIVLKFVAFDLEDGSDFLSVNGIGGDSIAEYTGSNIPEPLATGSNQVIVNFNTNEGGQATGFHVDWEAV
ncbi:procollagen C-endopeptidase enhancer 1-like [Ptychodera flava]|uniref:procollagen C-endopeptidase enhancer 1-like n=1 Tax=Ptychodera flava TaxID=63121 RepID=UPI00396A1B88